jgi:hypothetical protein
VHSCTGSRLSDDPVSINQEISTFAELSHSCILFEKNFNLHVNAYAEIQLLFEQDVFAENDT